jgi:hypothetical protein
MSIGHNYSFFPPKEEVAMAIDTLAELVGFPGGWIVGVSYALEWGYRCWVVTPELTVLTDGEFYESSLGALRAGRFLVEHSLEVE